MFTEVHCMFTAYALCDELQLAGGRAHVFAALGHQIGHAHRLLPLQPPHALREELIEILRGDGLCNECVTIMSRLCCSLERLCHEYATIVLFDVTIVMIHVTIVMFYVTIVLAFQPTHALRE